ncbi:ABC transporter substrate-binding protein [Saccharopolyspora sp. 5N708]|uniref:ABC transporter substrate-binding protein n=1 Tax=Saccharopolyspora sp. 5N708 TaxID=3457424 RepID=UPI003FD1651F
MRGRVRRLCAVGTAILVALVSTGCTALLPPAEGSNAVLTAWAISAGGEEELLPPAAEAFERRTGKPIQVQFFQNDPYKNKLWVSMGSGNPPDAIFGWGGGPLKTFVDAGKIVDLAPQMRADPQWRQRFLPSVMGPVDQDGHTYGVPIGSIQPVVLFYNKDVFESVGLQPPRTWQQLTAAVPRLQQAGYIPISLGGADAWTYLMWEEALVDRVAGPEAFQAVLDGKPGAWQNPDIVRANRMLQDLVQQGAFGDSFTSTSAELNQQTALVTSGRAAMTLHLGSAYPTMLENAPDFVRNGRLGWLPFPAVEGGRGDPANLFGNPATFMSATTGPRQDEAVDFLRHEVSSPEYSEGTIARGEVPPVVGIEDRLRTAENSDWLLFVYDLAKNAPHFQQSWDQALPPGPAQNLLTNLQKLFLEQITAQEFSSEMEESPR